MAKQLNLTPTGRTTVFGVNSQSVKDTYIVDIGCFRLQVRVIIVKLAVIAERVLKVYRLRFLVLMVGLLVALR